MKIILEFVATVLIADFVSGLIHWLEDAYGREDWPIIGRLVTRPNILHHHDPRYFTGHTWLHSSWDLMCLAAVVVAGAWVMGLLTWQVWCFAVLGANANQIHKWAHRSASENGPLIHLLQTLRLIQTPRHHAKHHADPKNSHYCVITDFLNPVLDAVGFFGLLERCVWVLFGVRRRVDTSIHSTSRQQAEFRNPEHIRTSNLKLRLDTNDHEFMPGNGAARQGEEPKDFEPLMGR